MSEESKNLEIWNKVKAPPTDALKTIIGGRLKGMSNIDPTWRLKALTEIFGPCGFGWKYEVKKMWSEQAGEEFSSYVLIDLYVNMAGEWSLPIPGIGGSMLLEKEKHGLHHSDESYKMALTDALSVACKALGFAADIYLGKFDGTKYNESGADRLQEPGPITPAQVEELRKWVEVFKNSGETQSVEFINANLASWSEEVAQLWIGKFNTESKGFKTW